MGLDVMTESGSTAVVQPQLRWRRTSVWMTTGTNYTRPSSTSMSPQALSVMRLPSVMTSPPSLGLTQAHLCLWYLTISTGASHSLLSRHQTSSLDLPQSTLLPPHLGLRTTMWPQFTENPDNWPRTSTVVPLLQVLTLINSSSFA